MRKVLYFGKSLLLACVLCTSVNCLAQVTQKWVQRQNGDANNPDFASTLVLDQKSNVIVTGVSEGKGTGGDFATIKYNDDGDTKWVKRYNGPGNGEDVAVAAAVDSKGNTYVTGYSAGKGSDYDFATIKYDEDGNTQWVQRFNGPGNGDDRVKAIAVDEDGNVYVTGWSTGNGTGEDITTIKYNKDGDPRWVKRYNGTGNGNDEAAAIAVDNYGNVYVTGYSTGNGTDGDVTTIKYDRDGDTKWIKKYNGPINDFDEATALAVDNAGNVYITGYITTVENMGEGPQTDIATIKYNTAGNQQWVKIYNRMGHDVAEALKIDEAGNIYITGFSGFVVEDPPQDYITIKYNTNGVQQWATAFISPGNGENEIASDLVLDAAGNVYVTGGSSIQGELDYVTIKYNNNGVQQWMVNYNGPGNDVDIANAIGIDKNGNIYITGRSDIDNTDYATIKYNSAGVQKWLKRYNGPGGESKGGADMANALAVDKEGNVHVTGGMTRLKIGLDYTTYKYKTNGDRDWKKTYNGPGVGPDEAAAITLDAGGNVYVTGSSFGKGSRADFATVKYDKEGNTQWSRRYNGADNDYDRAIAIAVDEKGNVYVTGYSSVDTFYTDFATIKYDKDGNTKWVRKYSSPDKGSDLPAAIGVDKDGNVYVTGSSWYDATFQDYITIRYDANGNQQWVARYNGPDNSTDGPSAMAIDARGNVYVTGMSWGTGTSADYATIKYNSAGVQQWVARYDGDFDFDFAKDIALDATGNVYVTGYSGNNGSGDDYVTVKYNAAGIQQWAARYDAANSQDEANALAVDVAGNVYVTGLSRLGNSLFEDYATIKYNAAGVQQWVARYSGPGNQTDVATDIGLDKYGNVYVTGYSTGYGTNLDYLTIKYEQTPLITTREVTTPEQRNLVKLTANAFPNAFTQNINLQWSGGNDPVSITITDAMGRLVEKRTGLASSGVLQTGTNFPQGIYYAEIVQGAEKMILKLVKE